MANAKPDDRIQEQISRMEATIRDLEDTGHRSLLLARDLRRQVETLKNGPAEPKAQIKDWKAEMAKWRRPWSPRS